MEKGERSTAPVWIINPTFVIKNWGKKNIALKVNGKMLKAGKDYFVGYEQSKSGIDMVLWINLKSKIATTFEVLPI